MFSEANVTVTVFVKSLVLVTEPSSRMNYD